MNKLWKYTKTILTVSVLILFIYYFSNNKESLTTVLSIPFNYLILIMFFYLTGFVLNAIYIKRILSSFNKVLPFSESLYLSVVSSLGNYFLPMRGGTVAKSVYLKKKFKFPYSQFISTLYGTYIVVFLVNSFIALIALLVIHLRFDIYSVPLYLFFILLFVSMVVLSIIKFPVKKIKETKNSFLNRFLNIFKSILEGWNIIARDKSLLIFLFFLTLGNFIIGAIIFFIQFKALRINANFMNIVLYNSLSGVSLLVSLTPGSLGIREGLFVITSDILGITNEEIMQLALLDRGLVIGVLLIAFLIIISFKSIPFRNGGK